MGEGLYSYRTINLTLSDIFVLQYNNMWPLEAVQFFEVHISIHDSKIRIYKTKYLPRF
jgi:hypothetical protein